MTEKVEKTIRTTIKLRESLWCNAKIYAAKKGLKLTQIVEEALKEYLKKNEES